MMLEERITVKWQQTYEGCDPAVEGNPRKYSHGWFRAGYMAGLEDARDIKAQVLDQGQIRREKQIRDAGYAQGIAYAAWVTASAQYELGDGLSVHQAARIAQEAILTALRAVEELARERVLG